MPNVPASSLHAFSEWKTADLLRLFASGLHVSLRPRLDPRKHGLQTQLEVRLAVLHQARHVLERHAVKVTCTHALRLHGHTSTAQKKDWLHERKARIEQTCPLPALLRLKSDCF